LGYCRGEAAAESSSSSSSDLLFVRGRGQKPLRPASMGYCGAETESLFHTFHAFHAFFAVNPTSATRAGKG
jgi:hypothetical protein